LMEEGENEITYLAAVALCGTGHPQHVRTRILSTLLHREPCFHPALFALGIVPNLRVAHGRQFTGGVFAGVSMRVRAVGHYFSILVGQHLRCKFLDFVRRNVQGSGKVSFAVAFRCKRLNHLDAVVAI
jgi:hypothetical protein